MRGGDRRRARASAEDGAVAVEFALVVPLLLMLVFGIVDFGWMINRDMLVDNASRDGVRVASLGGTFSEVCTAVKSELADSGIPTPATCNSTATPTSISISCKKVDGTSCNATATTYDTLAISGTTAVVTINYAHTWVTPLIASVFGRSRNIVETTQMVVE